MNQSQKKWVFSKKDALLVDGGINYYVLFASTHDTSLNHWIVVCLAHSKVVRSLSPILSENSRGPDGGVSPSCVPDGETSPSSGEASFRGVVSQSGATNGASFTNEHLELFAKRLEEG